MSRISTAKSDNDIAAIAPPARFSRKAAAIELRALAEAVNRITDPSLRWQPDRVLRHKQEIVSRLERLASEVSAR